MSVDNELNTIKNNPYIETMRNAIHDGIKKGYDKSVESELTSINALSVSQTIEERYREQILAQDLNPDKDPELVDARNGSATLGDQVRYIDSKVNANKIDLEGRSVNLNNYPRVIPEDSDSPRIKRALDDLKTTEYTEAVPEQGAKGLLFIPAGRYKITEKIPVTSYMHILGAGRHATIFDSYITNGDPVFDVREITDVQQFYVTLEAFTINGRKQECKGISIYRTSRWILRDVMIDGTLHEGLDIYRSFLGEVYSPLIRACGSAGYYAVVLSGTSSTSGGSHAISFYGGEINGGTGTEHAVFVEYGNSSGFFGTTIEGFRDGRGITVQNANAFFVHGCYFELNKEDIVETGETLGNSYRDNIHADLAVGARGIIGITYAQGLTLSGGYMQGDDTVEKVFDATNDGTGKLHMSTIQHLYSTNFPINISPSLLESAKRSGTNITGFDGEAWVSTRGQQRFVDDVEFLDGLKAMNGIKDLNGFTRTNIVAGNGSPETKELADPSSIYLREDGVVDTVVYAKTSGINNSSGWLPIQVIKAGTTDNRPAVTTIGFQYFDSSIGKPIWWAGTNWKDSQGTVV